MVNKHESADDRERRLAAERIAGEKYNQAYEQIFKDFISEAELRLFEAFKHASPTDKDFLQVLRLQLAAYASLSQHLNTYIDTGTLANIEMDELQH